MSAKTTTLHFSAAKLHSFSFEIAHYFNFSYNIDNLVIIYLYYVLKFLFWKIEQLNFMNYVIINIICCKVFWTPKTFEIHLCPTYFMIVNQVLIFFIVFLQNAICYSFAIAALYLYSF